MSSTQFQAMLCAANDGGTGERELKKHLSAHFGKGFCPTRRSVNMLAKGQWWDTLWGSAIYIWWKRESWVCWVDWKKNTRWDNCVLTKISYKQISHAGWCCARSGGRGWQPRRHRFSVQCICFCSFERWRNNWFQVISCRKPPSYVLYKGTYVPYDGTFGAPDQGQTLDVWGDIQQMSTRRCQWHSYSEKSPSHPGRKSCTNKDIAGGISAMMLDHTDKK